MKISDSAGVQAGVQGCRGARVQGCIGTIMKILEKSGFR
jgi:hypothetical protein